MGGGIVEFLPTRIGERILVAGLVIEKDAGSRAAKGYQNGKADEKSPFPLRQTGAALFPRGISQNRTAFFMFLCGFAPRIPEPEKGDEGKRQSEREQSDGKPDELGCDQEGARRHRRGFSANGRNSGQINGGNG